MSEKLRFVVKAPDCFYDLLKEVEENYGREEMELLKKNVIQHGEQITLEYDSFYRGLKVVWNNDL